MMPDEPSGYELQRNIDALRADVRDVVANVGTRLDKKVSADTHAAEVKRIEERIDGIKEDVAAIQVAQERDRQTARVAKQWAIGVAVSSAGVIVTIVAVIGDKI